MYDFHHAYFLCRPGVPKPGVGTPSGVGMVIMWGHKQVMGSVGSLRYRQGMGVQNIQAGGTRHLVKFNGLYSY